ncbi:MAG: protein kinase domain-containing protein [Deltaproteobacteria bacterium]
MTLVPHAGLIVADRYRLLHKVGTGGMGEVWASDDLLGKRVVALKLVREGVDDAPAREALLREARAAQALRHPNVLEIQDVLDVGGQPLLVMDLLEGETLAGRLQRTPRLEIDELIALALPVVSALGTAHAAGLVHRDLKPENIFLDARGTGPTRVRVLDFGIARRSAIDAETAQSTGLTTTTGLLIGTPAYMSPEQLYGESDLDHRSDLWSLGIVLYQCLAGFLPTLGDNLGQVIKAVVARPFEPIGRLRPDAPERLAGLVERLLARDRNARPRDASEVFEVLRALSPSAARDVPAPAPLPAGTHPPLKRRPRRLAAIAGIATVLIAAVALVYRSVDPRAVPPPAVVPAWPAIACPPWQVLSGSDDDRWLGAAAAATACERTRVILGGAGGRTLSPAELLDLPAHPFDRDDGSALLTAAGRNAALEAARRRGAIVFDGEVGREEGRFRIRLRRDFADGTPFFEGPSLYEAIRAALDEEEKRGRLTRASLLDPAWAEWSRARDVGGALALLDFVYALAQNARALDPTCRALEAAAGVEESMRQFVRWQCAYTRGVKAAEPQFRANSPGQVALLARVEHAVARRDPPETIAELQRLLDREPSALGRSTLAATLSCLLQASDPESAARFARRAVSEEPRNLLGDFCAPWGQVLVTTSDTASSAAAARAIRAWAPWDSSGWYWPPGASSGSIDLTRRAYQLSPLDTNVANLFVDRLLAAGKREEARSIALSLSNGPDPVHRLASELIQVRLDSMEGRLAGSLRRALKAVRAADDADSGWVRVQRLELGVRAVEVAEVLGKAHAVANEVVRQLIVRDPPLLDGAYLTVPAQVPAICARCSPAMARRCFIRFAAMKDQLSGGILGGTAAFAEGARFWAAGDGRAAARAFRPLLNEPELYVALLPLAMAQSFATAGDEEAVHLVAEKAEVNAAQLHGALALHAFLAERADRRGESANACALATRVMDAWSAADARVPALVTARAVAARRCRVRSAHHDGG